MPIIFTILNHGTNFHHHKHNEFIASLSRLIDGVEVEIGGIHTSGADSDPVGDFMITEGPGSKSGKIDAPTPGQVNPFTMVEKKESKLQVDTTIQDQAKESVHIWFRSASEILNTHQLPSYKGNLIKLREDPTLDPRITGLFIKASKGIASMTGPAYKNILKYGPELRHQIAATLRDDRKDFVRHFYGEVHGKNHAISGLLSGTGWEDNVLRAVNIVANLQPLPDIVNLVGWSRGAITCFKQARLFNEIFGTEIDINIFAVDPVYGGKGGTPEGEERVVTDNVKNLVTILALHDKRKTFKPHDLNTMQINRGATEAVFLPMAGDHSSVVQPKLNLAESAKLTFDIAIKWLTFFGTRFKSPYSLSPLQACKLYGDMIGSAKEYQKKTGGMLTLVGSQQRDVANEYNRYVLGPALFVNEHHRMCFKTSWPRVYDWLFGPPPADASNLAMKPQMLQMMQELKTLAQASPITAEIVDTLGQNRTGRNIESGVIDYRWPLQWPL